jgi:hypothetical protein
MEIDIKPKADEIGKLRNGSPGARDRFYGGKAKQLTDVHSEIIMVYLWLNVGANGQGT